MTAFEFGDVILVPFPFTDQSTSKKRPAIVISSRTYNEERQDLIIMAVTSRIRPKAAIAEVAIQHWQEAGLLKPSVVKPVVTKALGRLGDNDSQTLRASLEEIIG